MYKRIFTSLTIAFAMAGAAFTGTATARQLQESGATAVPSSTQTEVAGQSQQAIIRDKLQEIGAWAVPSNSTQTEIVPKSLPASPTTVVASSSDRFDWNDAGIGGAFVFGAVLLGAASLVTIRRHQHHGPVAH
jgi:hypothetical protein